MDKKNTKPVIVMLTHVVNKTATDGFLPAAVNMGYPVYILTDQALAHHQHFSQEKLPSYPTEIIGCDVFNAQAIIDILLQQKITTAAIFTNSDHLQTACAQAASFSICQQKTGGLATKPKINMQCVSIYNKKISLALGIVR